MGFQGSFAVGGAIFNVAPDGALRWYRYDGTGQQDPTGGTGWAPNSGNQIGRGWSAGFRTFFGTEGVIYAVGEDGALRWYRYDGTGQQDPTGGTGWAPNSGNQIGRGWSGGFDTFFAVNRAIYAVGGDGALRWYQYDGKGEQDPTGSTGWAPNSGNQIGRGWSAGFRTFIGTKGAIFAVPDDGALRWYRYDGTGQQDPTGGTGWAPNSGNQIGRGWSAGFDTFFAVNRAIYAVGDDGALRWYQYDGKGEQDPTGSTGWAPNSGNQIGRGWSAGFRTFIGTKAAIFAVPDDGALRWYRYDGTGQQDPTGSTGWAPNSGNQIGRGWSAGFRNHFGTRGAIYTVADDGALRWYQYDGTGQQDPTGSTGWAPNSGNQIGRGWT